MVVITLPKFGSGTLLIIPFDSNCIGGSKVYWLSRMKLINVETYRNTYIQKYSHKKIKSHKVSKNYKKFKDLGKAVFNNIEALIF